MVASKVQFRPVHHAPLAHVTQAQAQRAEIGHVCESCGAARVRVSTAWVVAALDDHWTVAYRVAPQDGQPVVSEVRVYPMEAGQRAGEWSGRLLGVRADVPQGGLTARQLHRIPLGGHLVAGTQALAWIGQQVGPGAFEPEGMLGRFGFREPRRATPQRKRGPGRPGRDPVECARISALYVAARTRGSRRPVTDVAARVNLPSARVRDILHRSRTLGLLTPPAKRGEPGGTLTLQAHALLRGKQRKGGRS